jgi:hypothetical protein
MEHNAMSHEASSEHPTLGGEAVELAAATPLTFQPMVGVPGPTYEHWLQYLVYIRGAVAALKFDDRTLTERMHRGFDTDAEALDAVHAWAETERQLAAAIDILRTAQARCTLAAARVGTRIGRPPGTERARALISKA